MGREWGRDRSVIVACACALASPAPVVCACSRAPNVACRVRGSCCGQVILADRVSLDRRFLLGPAEARALLLLLQFYANAYGIRIHTVV